MKLSLSVRIAESPKRKDVAALPIEQLAPLAAAAGFTGMSMRASVVSIDSPPSRVAEVRGLLDGLGLAVSMVTGDLPLAINNAEATRALRGIGLYLDLADGLGCGLLRVMMHGEDDIPAARRAADEAAERGIALSHQMHFGSLFETVDGAMDVLRRVDRPNFGVTFEPANMLACGDPYDAESVKRLSPWLLNVYFQNIRLDPGSPMTFNTRTRGPVNVRYVALDDPSGIDPAPLISALKSIGYDGWFSVHQPDFDGQGVDKAVREAADLFRPMLADR
jgi:sugar phosphate isomerase/epimerase